MLQSNKKPARLPIAARRFSAVEAPCLLTLWSAVSQGTFSYFGLVSRIGLLHALLVGLDHLLDHLTADTAGFLGGQVTVITSLAASILNLLRASLASGTTGPVIVTYTPYSFLSFRYSCRGPCCPQNLYSGGISVARCFLYCYVQSRPVQTWNILVDSSSGIKEQLSIVEIHHFAHSKQKSIYFQRCPSPHPALFSESSGTWFIKLPIICEPFLLQSVFRFNLWFPS